jgi:anti-sigma B factor antagonist
MPIPEQLIGDRVLLSPNEPLVTGGAAEVYEQRVQELLKRGRIHIVTDLEHVAHLDSSGVRALIRGHITAQRMGGTYGIARVNPRNQRLLHITRLDTIFAIFETVDEALNAKTPPVTTPPPPEAG